MTWKYLNTSAWLFLGCLNQWDSRWWSFCQPRAGARYGIPDIRASCVCHGFGAFSIVYKAELYVPGSFLFFFFATTYWVLLTNRAATAILATPGIFMMSYSVPHYATESIHTYNFLYAFLLYLGLHLHLRQAFFYYFHPTKAKVQCLPLCHVSFYHLLEPPLLITLPPNFHSDQFRIPKIIDSANTTESR